MSIANEIGEMADLPHVLVIDDDDRIRDLVARYLNENGFLAMAAEDAMQADIILKSFEFDALVVDVMMPGKTGLEFVKDLRIASDIPVIMLTALGELDDKTSGFEVGADDYLPKPFEPKELVMRLQAIIKRRPAKKDQAASLQIGPWVFDPVQKELAKEGERISLTDVEANLLQQLGKRPNEVLSRDALAKLCDVEAGGRAIDVQVTRLRRKLEENSKNPRYLQTVRGKGYILRVGAE